MAMLKIMNTITTTQCKEKTQRRENTKRQQQHFVSNRRLTKMSALEDSPKQQH